MRIVIGIDHSAEAEQACWFVADRTWPAGTSVILVGAYTPRVEWASYAAIDSDVSDDRHAALKALLEQRADIFRRLGRLPVRTEIGIGAAGDVLCQVAADNAASLLVVGSRRRGPLSSAILGSVSAHVVDHASCPVLVVRQPTATRMLVATDGTPSSRSIPEVLAAWSPAFRGPPVEVVSVAPRYAFVTPWAGHEDEDDPAVEDLAFHREIAERVADQMMDLGWHTAAVARAGDPDREIVAAGAEWGADLIVTGSRGIGTLRRILAGSVAHEVLLHTRSSVLVVRGQVPAPAGRVRVTMGAAALS
jgi:nucleotide-binding universal stress UspA family protein